RELACEEFLIRSELTGADIDFVEEAMLVPEFRKAVSRQRFDVARRQDVVEIVARQSTAVNRERVEVNRAAFPPDEFSEVRLEDGFKAAGVDCAAADAAREVRLAVADIGELIL